MAHVFQKLKIKQTIEKTIHFGKNIFGKFFQVLGKKSRPGTGPAGRDLEKLVPGRDRDLTFGPVCHAYIKQYAILVIFFFLF